MNRIIRQLKRIEEAELADVREEHRQTHILLAINSNLVTLIEVLAEQAEQGEHMSEQVDQLNTKFDEIGTALETEHAEILAAIEAARNEGGATEAELAALNVRAENVKAAIAALVTPPVAVPPPDDEPIA